MTKMKKVNARTEVLPNKNTAMFLTACDYLISWMRSKIKSTKNCCLKNKDLAQNMLPKMKIHLRLFSCLYF